MLHLPLGIARELSTERRESYARLTLVTPKPSSLLRMEEERHNQNLSADESPYTASLSQIKRLVSG